MDLTQNKPIIINRGIGGWYAVGSSRLERSLMFHGWAGDACITTAYPDASPKHEDNPYAFKPYAFQEAFDEGYKIALWCDSSFWTVRNPMPMIDFIVDNGLYMFKSGYSLRQTCSDALSNHFGITREELTDVPEFATGCVGINIDNPIGKEFFERWMDMCKLGLFKGNRAHDYRDSIDPEFKFSRQDQSAASMALHLMGIKNINAPEWIAYKGTGYNEKELMFFIEGL